MTTPPVQNFSFITCNVKFLTVSPTKGRSYRPKAFRFSFHKNIDRYRIFHCPRGRGYSLCVLGVTTINYTIFSLSVDQKINVPGDHTFPIFCDRNWFPLVVSENGFNHRGKGALPLRFKHRPHRFLYHSETFFQFSCRLLGVKHRPEPDLVMGALCWRRGVIPTILPPTISTN